MPALRPEPLEDRAVPSARLQVINDLPPLTGLRPSVDVYVDGGLIAGNLAAGDGTPFVTVPSGVPLQLDVMTAGTTGTVSTLKVTLADNSTHVAVAARYTGPLDLAALGRETSADSSGTKTDLLIFNGTSALPKADVRIRGIGTVANDLALGSSTKGYLSLAAGSYTVDVFRADGAMRLATFTLDLSSGAGGKAAVLALGGSLVAASFRLPAFVDPAVVFADGSTPALPSASAVSRPSFAASVAGKVGLFDQTGTALQGRTVAGTTAPPAIAADTDGDGIEELISADPAGGPSVVDLGAAADRIVNPFEPSFTGGVFLAAGDFDGDGFDDIVVTPDQGGAARVRVFSGKALGTLADFFGIDDTVFRGGARPAVGDVNGDGTPDLIVAAGFGGGPRVAIYDGKDLAPGRTPRKLVADFFVFEPTLRNGVFVAAGDLDGNGTADPIFGGGPGGGPRVFALNGGVLTFSGDQLPVADFFAGDSAGRTGVRVAAHYFDADINAEVVAGLGTGTDPQVRVVAGVSIRNNPAPAATDLTPFPGMSGAVFVG